MGRGGVPAALNWSYVTCGVTGSAFFDFSMLAQQCGVPGKVATR